MPELSRFFGIVVRMYYDDHNPPHVHIKSLSVNTSCLVRSGCYTMAREYTQIMDRVGCIVGACRAADTEAQTGQGTQVPTPAGRGQEANELPSGV
jgi:hypothetical protein